MRIGQGFDVHVFAEGRGNFKIKLGGISIPHNRQILAHSDGDVAIHALCDALLGALALGDIGQHFPDADSSYKNADSRELLRIVMSLVQDKHYKLGNADITIIAEAPKISPLAYEMKCLLAEDMNSDISRVSVKATTTEKAGFIGRGEGIAVQAVVLLEPIDS